MLCKESCYHVCTMPHPHEYLLKEFAISIDKLVPLTPPAVVDEAKKLLAELAASENVTEKQLHDALVYVGRKEFPYRKAYEELCASDEEQRLQQQVFERVAPAVKEKLLAVTEHGVQVMDYVNSRLFEEQLPADERYQVEQAILLAHDALNTQCSERATKRHHTYQELVAKWQAEQERLQGLLMTLRSFADRDAKWKGEILARLDQLEEGWSVVERDPKEEEIRQELEYWTTVFAENEEGAPVSDEAVLG